MEPITADDVSSPFQGTQARSVTSSFSSTVVGTTFPLAGTRFTNGTNTMLLPLGTVQLRGNYVSGVRTFGLAGSATLSPLTWNGSRLTVTLGTASSSTNTVTSSTNNMTWTPVAATKDLFGAATLTTPTPVTDNDNDF